MEDADTVLVSMGSTISDLKEAVDTMREKGKKIGVLKIRILRPYPAEEIKKALSKCKRVICVEKAISLGGPGILASELKSAIYHNANKPEVSNFIIGLGGRDVKQEHIFELVEKAEKGVKENEFIGLDAKLVEVMG